MRLKRFILNNRRIFSGMGMVSLVPLLSSSLITAFLIQNQSYFQALSSQQWLPFFALSALTMATAITPTTFIALISGYFLGWQAGPPMIASYLLASMLGFVLGKQLDGGRLMSGFEQNSKVSLIIEEVKKRDWSLMVLLRISPVLPFSLINLLLPATGLRFKVFVVAGFIGMLPRTLFSIWAGLQAHNLTQLLQNPDQNNSATVLLIVTALVSVGGLLIILSKASTSLLTAKSSN